MKYEVKQTDGKVTIAAGGRYDDKVGKYIGKQIPAVGISFGTLIDYGEVDIMDLATEYLVVSLGRDKEAIKLAQKLRENGKSVIIYYGKPSKALDYANSYYIKKTIRLYYVKTKKRRNSCCSKN